MAHVNIPVKKETRDAFKALCDKEEVTYDKMLKTLMKKVKK